MKLAVAIASDSAPDSAFVVWRGFEASIEKASRYGFHGIELALKTADEVDAAKLDRWLQRRNVEVSCISTGQVFAGLGLYFTHPDPAGRERLIAIFEALVDLAADHGRMVNVGRSRGYYSESQSREEVEGLFIDTARRICDYAAPKGVSLIIEPVNRYEINFVNNLDEGAELLARVERANLGLMPDVFHMNIEDAHIGENLARYKDLVLYIHLADSNRLAPGQGHLDFDDVFDGLRRADFDGWASIEILPRPDPDTAARQAVERVLPMIERYNASRVNS